MEQSEELCVFDAEIDALPEHDVESGSKQNETSWY